MTKTQNAEKFTIRNGNNNRVVDHFGYVINKSRIIFTTEQSSKDIYQTKRKSNDNDELHAYHSVDRPCQPDSYRF
jgi:hypothetical protein